MLFIYKLFCFFNSRELNNCMFETTVKLVKQFKHDCQFQINVEVPFLFGPKVEIFIKRRMVPGFGRI